MRYLTPNKVARGLGAAGPSTATAAHWSLTVSSVALAILTPAFVYVIGRAIGLPREGVIAYFGRPYPAIITAAFLIVGFLHYIRGTRIMIDDYLDHAERKVAIIASHLFGWAVIAAAGYALARMALAPAMVMPVSVSRTVVVAPASVAVVAPAPGAAPAAVSAPAAAPSTPAVTVTTVPVSPAAKP